MLLIVGEAFNCNSRKKQQQRPTQNHLFYFIFNFNKICSVR